MPPCQVYSDQIGTFPQVPCRTFEEANFKESRIFLTLNDSGFYIAGSAVGLDYIYSPTARLP
jgi:hypothetical protein